MNKHQLVSQQRRPARLGQMIAFLVLTSSLPFISYATIPNAFLSVDFNTASSPTETGFQSFVPADLPSKTFSTIYGNLTVTASGGNMTDRGGPGDSGPFTYSELYEDFHWEVSAPINFTLSGPAIVPNSPYQITWYSWSIHPGDDATTQFASTPASNTSGSIGSVTHLSANTPTSDLQYSFTGIWTSTDNSLEITATRLSGGGINLINGFEIVPEPSSVVLLALGGLALMRRWNRNG